MKRTALIIAYSSCTLLFFSCGHSEVPGEGDTVGDTMIRDSLSVTAQETPSRGGVPARDSFMLDSFLVLIDSFYTAYAQQEIHLRYHRDSLTQRDTSYHSRRYIYKPMNGSFARWHYIDGGAGTSTMEFELAECCYPDSLSADEGWKEFKRLSGPDFRSAGNDDDYFPCLSYGSDYAFRSGNSVFWLCTYCNWDYDKHLVIAQLLKRSIVQCKPSDEIKCRCGDVKPRAN